MSRFTRSQCSRLSLLKLRNVFGCSNDARGGFEGPLVVRMAGKFSLILVSSLNKITFEPIFQITVVKGSRTRLAPVDEIPLSLPFDTVLRSV